MERLSAVEAQLGGKTLEQQFREQAELIDRLFIYRFEELDSKWDAKLDAKLEELEAKLDAKLEEFEAKVDAKLEALEAKLEAKLEVKLEEKLGPLRADLAVLKDAVQLILIRLPQA